MRTQENGVVVDLTGKRNGRGAYLCDQAGCWERALSQSQLLDQALMTNVTLEERAEIATFKPAGSEVAE